jgi:methyl-accepting chemotaxis protein
MTGKGFAVVAGEAEEPAGATEPAAQQVRAIQDDADEVVLALTPDLLSWEPPTPG